VLDDPFELRFILGATRGTQLGVQSGPRRTPANGQIPTLWKPTPRRGGPAGAPEHVDADSMATSLEFFRC